MNPSDAFRFALPRPVVAGAMAPVLALCLGCAGLFEAPPPPTFPLPQVVDMAPARTTYAAAHRPDWGAPTLETVDEQEVCRVEAPQQLEGVVSVLTFSTREGTTAADRCDRLIDHTLRGDEARQADAVRMQLDALVEVARCPDWLKVPGTEHQDLRCARMEQGDGLTTYVTVRSDRRDWHVSHTVEPSHFAWWVAKQGG